MRERLTAAFVLFAVLLLLGAGIVRSFILRDLVREQEGRHVQRETALVTEVIAERVSGGAGVDRDFLAGLVGPEHRLEYTPPGAAPIVVTGDRYGSQDPRKDLSASSDAAGAEVTVSRSPERVSDIVADNLTSLAVMLSLFAVAGGIVGFLVSRALSAPFRRLATAAAALGRGRFDLDLPASRIPEARAIADALRTSAGQLEERLRRERDFAEHASHVLRTPLTGLRLELEDLTLRDGVPEDARAAAARGLASVDEMNAVAGKLVELARTGSLVKGAELPLVELATQLAQRWADRLAARDRTLDASAEGDLELAYTPGPVEHVLDLLLAEVVRRGSGPVRIVFRGQDGGHLRVTVSSEGPARPRGGEQPEPRLDQARAVVQALGGRLTGDDPARGLEVLLPRR